MSRLIGLNGQPIISRQQKREVEREASKNTGKIFNSIASDIRFLAFQGDVLVELLNTMGVTKEQFQEASERVSAKYTEAQKAEVRQ